MKAGRLTAAIGASRSGKSAFVMNEIKGRDRVLVWDIKGEYSGFIQCRTKSQLFKAVNAPGNKGRISFIAQSLDDFEYFCRIAAAWVQLNYVAGNKTALVFEETADVTSPGKAPKSYGILLRRFLSYGVDIFAITQRPAESDKTAVGNASIVRVCRLQLARDKKSASGDTGIPYSVIAALKADQDKGQFDFVHADTGAGHYRLGRLSFSTTGKPVFKNFGRVESFE